MKDYTSTCNACFAASCGVCSPPADKVLNEGSTLLLRNAQGLVNGLK